jgi:hypothetical protein
MELHGSLSARLRQRAAAFQIHRNPGAAEAMIAEPGRIANRSASVSAFFSRGHNGARVYSIIGAFLPLQARKNVSADQDRRCTPNTQIFRVR